MTVISTVGRTDQLKDGKTKSKTLTLQDQRVGLKS